MASVVASITKRSFMRILSLLGSAAVACAFLPAYAADSNTSGSNVNAPGAPASGKTKALEAGAALLQSKPPVDALNAYLNGFHFYNGNMKGQMDANHYCSILNDEVIQCVIFDGNVKDAKIMGVEYIVSEKLFRGLPEEEKALWHSHVHEVKSGTLIAPGIPEIAEKELMKKLVSTYGKTWHTWHTDLNKELPIGVPQLMMGSTADGQIDPKIISARDNKFEISSEEKRKDRADLPTPAIVEGANAWEKGRTVQIADPTGTEHSHPKGAQTSAPTPSISPPARK
jgi:hypothetical protein